jgi:BirA family biotin operon repressor/biotin-[acetyl-CoA-carboxylase] ligase
MKKKFTSYKNSIHLKSVDSTNEEAKRRLKDLAEPTWITAEQQQKGKGRKGRTWLDGKNNFTGTLVIFPEEKYSNLFFYGLFIGVALYDTVTSYLSFENDIFLKWPNDLILAKRKLSGILIESQSLEKTDELALIIGIGVNLNSTPSFEKDHKTRYSAISLKEYLGYKIDVADFFYVFKEKIKNLEETINLLGMEKIVDLWLKRTYEVGSEIEVKNGNGEVVAGRFSGINSTGGILIGTKKNIVTLHSGDVFFRG